MKKFVFFFFVFFLTACGKNSSTTIVENNPENTPSQTTSQTVVVGEKIAKDPGYNQCITSATYACGNEFIRAYAVNNSSTDICAQFGDENLQNSCKEMVISETAKKTLDADRCNDFSDADKKISCRQNVLIEKGVKDSDPTVCSNLELTSTDIDTLENLKDRCMIHIINLMEVTEKTKGLCGLIISEEAKMSCESRIQEILDIQKINEQ